MLGNKDIVQAIDAQIAKLQQARKLLSNDSEVKLPVAVAKPKLVKGTQKQKRVLSAEARKRIAEAQKKRWAAQKTA